jgi:hypothetical protein
MLIISVVELLATVGAQTLRSLVAFFARYDWLSAGLTLIAEVVSIPVSIIDGLTFMLVSMVCFVTVITYTRGTSYRFAELRRPQIALATSYLVILFVLFVLPRGGLGSITAFLSRQELKFLYRFLLSLTLSAATLLPLLLGIYRPVETDSLPPLRAAALLSGSAFLFAGGLATLASMDGAIALVTILVSVYRLSGYSRLPHIAPEENLVRSLTIVGRDSMGFAIFFCCITGIVMAANLLRLASSNSFTLTLLRAWKILPVLNTLTLIIFIIAGVGAITLLVGLLRISRLEISGSTLSPILVGGLWAISIVLFLIGSFFGLDRLPVKPSDPLLYPILLATGLVILEWIRNTKTSRVWYLTGVLIFCILIGYLMFQRDPYPQTLFLDFALIGYWGGPLFEWLGRHLRFYFRPRSNQL